ncbi:hypothetical protein ACWDZ6_17730 [Streptomyces sp. NPDC002926]
MSRSLRSQLAALLVSVFALIGLAIVPARADASATSTYLSAINFNGYGRTFTVSGTPKPRRSRTAAARQAGPAGRAA